MEKIGADSLAQRPADHPLLAVEGGQGNGGPCVGGTGYGHGRA